MKIIVGVKKPANNKPTQKQEKFTALQRHNTENFKQIYSGKGIARPQSQFPHSFVCEQFIYISTVDLPILLQENMWTDPGNP
jgi:hypothetical protein